MIVCLCISSLTIALSALLFALCRVVEVWPQVVALWRVWRGLPEQRRIC